MKLLPWLLIGALIAGVGCSSKTSNVALAPTVSTTPSGPSTPVPTTRLGTRPPGATARPTAAAAATPAGSPSAGIPPVPPGTPPLQTTASGLQYQDITVGTGAQPQSGQTVTVNYIGWLDNGTKFDASADHPPGTFSFTLGQGKVIKGWDEGVATMKVGGKRRLVIPPSLGYGSQQVGQIPPNSRLTFDIELQDVK